MAGPVAVTKPELRGDVLAVEQPIVHPPRQRLGRLADHVYLRGESQGRTTRG